MFIVVFRKGPRDNKGYLGHYDKLVWANSISILRTDEGQEITCHQHDVTEYSDRTGPVYFIPDKPKDDDFIHFYIKDIRTGNTISPWSGKIWGNKEN